MLREMYRDQRYLDVITMFKNKSATTAVTEWDYSFYMNSLYKLNKYKECLACYKEFVSKFKDSNLLNDKVGWAVYQLYVKDIEHKNVNINNLLNIAVYVINKSTDTEYSPKSTIFKKFVELLLEKGNESKTDWFRLKSFLEQINPDCLSRAEKVYSIDGGKQMRGASDVEYWYSRMTKALFALEEFEECIDVCNEGLNVLNKFHNNNDIWFNYRKAKCLFSLNKANEAATIVEEILNSGFSSEHLLMLMFQIEGCRGNFDEAMRYAAKSALFNREHQKRLKFYEEFASYLDKYRVIAIDILSGRDVSFSTAESA
jgi:tetratricopeptide (TPR) repeat protein